MIFGGTRAARPLDQIAAMLPGIVGGYGGGTFNTQGRQVTPSLPGNMGQLGDSGIVATPEQEALSASLRQRFPNAPIYADDAAPPALPMPQPRGVLMPQGGGLLGAPAGQVQTEARNPGDAAPRPATGNPAAGMPMQSDTGMGPSLPSPNAPRGLFGSSMRQPFDYEAVRNALLPPQKKHSTLHNILMGALEALPPALMSMGGNQAGANAFMEQMQRKRETEANRRFTVNKTLADWQHEDWARQNGADLRAATPFTIGRNRLQYDPTTGQVDPLYHGAADFEDYAAAQGLEPGTPDYFNAVEDYVLRGNGPTAFGFDKSLDDYRTGNRLKIEGVRQGNRVSLEKYKQGNRVDLRGVPTYRDTHGSPGRAAMPTVTSPDEAMKLPPGTKFRTPDGQVRVRP